MTDATPLSCRFLRKEGSLASNGLADLLPQIFWLQKSTCLELLNAQGEVERDIVFVDGLPTQLSSNLKSESFGQFLLENEFVSNDQFSDLIGVMMDQSISISDALVNTQFMEPASIVHAQRLHQERIFCNLLSSRQRWYRFIAPSTDRTCEDNAQPLSLGWIYASSIAEPLADAFLKMISEHAITLHSAFEKNMHRLGFSEQQWNRLINESPSTFSPEDWRILLTALDFQLLRVSLPHVCHYRHWMAMQTVLEPEAFADKGEASKLEWLISRWIRSLEISDADLLEVAPEAKPRELKAAYHQKVRQFHPDRFRGKIGEAAMDYSEHLFNRLTQAYESVKSKKSQEKNTQPRNIPFMLAEAFALLGQEHLMARNFFCAVIFSQAAKCVSSDNARSELILNLIAYIETHPSGNEANRQALLDATQLFIRKRSKEFFWLGIAASLLADEGQGLAAVGDLQKILLDHTDHPFLLGLLQNTVKALSHPESKPTLMYFSETLV